MADLSVGIGADIKGLNAGLAAANKEISNFSTNAQKNLSRFDNSVKSGGQSLQSFSVGSNRAGFALQNLGRVAQDAPFGFIGIQNNLNPLLESFQQLRKESGSNSAALKALGQSLIGPAGLGIALSVVGAAILFYQQYQQKSRKETGAAAKENLTYVETLDAVRGALLKGAQDAQKEIASLETLFRATRNTTLSITERNKAVDTLQAKFPAYFGNLTNEQVLTDKGSEAYGRLKNALIQVAQARAAENKIAQLASRQLENEQKITDERIKNQKLLLKQQSEVDKAFNNATSGSTRDGGALSDVVKLSSAKTKVAESDKIIFDLNTDNAKILKQQLDLVSKINQITAQSGVNPFNDGLKEANNKLKELNSTRVKATAIKADFTFDTLGLFNIQEEINKATGQNSLKIKIKPVLEIDTVFSDFELQTIESLKRFNDNASQIINGGIADTFGGLAAAIGGGLASGADIASQLGSVLLTSIGNIAIQLGQLAIGVGIGVKGIKTALMSLNPVLAIAAGAALVALGSFVKGAASNIGSGGSSGGANGTRIPGFATGVTNFKGGLAMVGERGPELLNLPTGSNVITNQNTNKLINSRGSSGSTTFIPDVRISGQDLVVVFNKAIQTSKRRG